MQRLCLLRPIQSWPWDQGLEPKQGGIPLVPAGYVAFIHRLSIR